MILSTALAFTLSVASQLQNEQDDANMTAEDWEGVAEDLRRVADFAQQRANEKYQEEER